MEVSWVSQEKGLKAAGQSGRADLTRAMEAKVGEKQGELALELSVWNA